MIRTTCRREPAGWSLLCAALALSACTADPTTFDDAGASSEGDGSTGMEAAGTDRVPEAAASIQGGGEPSAEGAVIDARDASVDAAVRSEGATSSEDSNLADAAPSDVSSEARGGLSDVTADVAVEALDTSSEGSSGASIDAPADAAALLDADSAPDGGRDAVVDGGPVGTYALIASLGDACLACAIDPDNACTGVGLDCESFGDGDANTAQQARCYETLGCMLSSGCADPSTAGSGVGGGVQCYCGDASIAACAQAPGAGRCREIEERNLESTSPTEILSTRFHDPVRGAGMANSIVNCLDSICADACFHARP